MNKILVLIIFLLLTLNGCYNYEQLQKNIIVKQIPCPESLVLEADTTKNQINGIDMFYDFEVYKTVDVYDNHPSYYGFNGNDLYMGGGQIEYIIEDNKLIPFPTKQHDELDCKPRTYRIRTGINFNDEPVEENSRNIPYPDSEKRKILQTYINKMKQLRQDTLHIGSIAEVQRTNPKFFNYFIQGDTIILKVIDCKKRAVNKFVPIEIK